MENHSRLHAALYNQAAEPSTPCGEWATLIFSLKPVAVSAATHPTLVTVLVAANWLAAIGVILANGAPTLHFTLNQHSRTSPLLLGERRACLSYLCRVAWLSPLPRRRSLDAHLCAQARTLRIRHNYGLNFSIAHMTSPLPPLGSMAQPFS